MQLQTNAYERWWQALNPRRSLRAQMSLTFGILVIILTMVFVASLEFTAVNANTSPELLVNRLERQIWVSGLALTVVFILVAWIIAGRIARPLHMIADAAKEIQGDGREHVIPTFPGKNEVASLSRSLNILVANLKTQQKALREANDLLEQRVAERTHQLTSLYEVLRISSELEEIEILLERALPRVLQAVRVGVGCIHLMDRDGQRLLLTARCQMPEPLSEAYAHLKLDHPIVQDTFREKSYLRIANLQADPRFSTFSPFLPDRQVLLLPVRKAEHNLGILTVIFQEDGSIREDNIALLSSLADQLGIMIENARLRQQAKQLAILEERNRLARELHDSVTQALYSATLFAEAAKKQAQDQQLSKALEYLDEVRETSRQALKEMRLLVYKLRPSPLEKEGLVYAVDQRLKAVEGRAGIQTKLEVVGNRAAVPAETEETLYYIAVEALNNSLKHAQASAVSVIIQQTETALTLQVTDNGRGFEWETAVSGGGLGLTSMRERASQHRGSLTVDSTPNQGTTVTAVLPINSAELANQEEA